MFKQRKATKRFTLLLLEEEEDYVHDWVATCKWPSGVTGCWAGAGAVVEGRVRLCTKSLFFDPDDVRLPIVRLPFAPAVSLDAPALGTAQTAAGQVPAAPSSTSAATCASSFSLTTTAWTKMKANMDEVPYSFEKGQAVTWAFTLLYAPLSAVLPLARQLYDAHKLPKQQRTLALEAFVRGREDLVAFDTSRLADFSERLLLDTPAIQLTPLVRERGHLVITDTRLYFQPMHNVSGDAPVRSHPLAGVAAFARRRSCLRPLGLELFFVRPSDASWVAQRALSGSGTMGNAPGVGGSNIADLEFEGGGQVWDGPSAFFAFRTEAERDSVVRQLSSSPMLGASVSRLSLAGAPGGFSSVVQAHSLLLEAQGGWLHRVTAAWQAAHITNFDYLLYLNLAAGRSFNDLAQWPVFPWVLRNFTSARLDLNDPANFRDLTKPVGALNPSRLAEFRKRYHDMPSDMMDEGAVPPFMYGTHYSTPGYVMYWLLRAAPAHMLRLQNGRFDAPDRLFHGLAESWESVNNSTTDVKELIPEFYLPGGNWLVNALRLPLGVRQSGQPVEDVELPPWAGSDTERFLSLHRAALEAPPVSRALHHWIDLIFGYKQTGPAAVEADNVFYHLTYEGAVDVSKVTDPVELKAFETQINEFGQTPKQLFHQPHPPRAVVPPAPDPSTVFSSLVAAPTTAAAGGDGALMSADVSHAGGPQVAASLAPRGGVSGSEAGHRALALALISAISQAAAVSPPPASLSPAVQGGEGREAGGAGDGQAGAAASSTLPGDAAARSAAGERGSSGAVAAAEAGVAGAQGQVVNGGAGGAAAALASASAGLLGGLLKLGRYGRTDSRNLQVGPSSAGGQTAAAGGSSSSGSLAAPSSSLHSASQADAGPSAGQGQPLPPPAAARSAAAHADATLVGGGGGATAAVVQRPAAVSPAPAVQPSGPQRWSVHLPDKLAAVGRPGAPYGVLTLRTSRDAITGLAVVPAGGPGASDSSQLVCSTSQSGFIRVAQAEWTDADVDGTEPSTAQHTLVRSQQLDGDLLCLAALPYGGGGGAGGRAAGAGGPLLLAGSHNQQVFAYDVSGGQLQGSFQAHDDAVCALTLGAGAAAGVGGGGAPLLFSSSWDCTIKVWSMAEGRQPWSWAMSSLAPQPDVTFDLGEGVWALAVALDGSPLVVGGTEEGRVVACDLRAAGRQPVWRADVAQDYVGGLALSPCGRYVFCGTADGHLSLLDVRNQGARLAAVSVDSPVRCCASDGWLLLAGVEAGVVDMWDVGMMSAARAGPVGRHLPAPSGLYAPWAPLALSGVGEAQGEVACSALHVMVAPASGGAVGGGGVSVGAGMEDGAIVLVRC